MVHGLGVRGRVRVTVRVLDMGTAHASSAQRLPRAPQHHFATWVGIRVDVRVAIRVKVLGLKYFATWVVSRVEFSVAVRVESLRNAGGHQG